MKYLSVLLILIAGSVFAETIDEYTHKPMVSMENAYRFNFGYSFGNSAGGGDPTESIFITGTTTTIFITGTTTIIEYTH